MSIEDEMLPLCVPENSAEIRLILRRQQQKIERLQRQVEQTGAALAMLEADAMDCGDWFSVSASVWNTALSRGPRSPREARIRLNPAQQEQGDD